MLGRALRRLEIWQPENTININNVTTGSLGQIGETSELLVLPVNRAVLCASTACTLHEVLYLVKERSVRTDYSLQQCSTCTNDLRPWRIKHE